jgi:hypothetical protein
MSTKWKQLFLCDILTIVGDTQAAEVIFAARKHLVDDFEYFNKNRK